MSLDGPDTALARLLHARGLLDLDTLRGALDEARAGRGRDPALTLAGVLATRGLVASEALAEATRALSGPARFGPYRAVRLLARGGMGEVHEVVHEGTGARYALKTLLAGGLQGALPAPEEIARFRAEAQLLARLDHPAIVRIHAADLEAGTPYLVQDLLPAGSLQQRLEREGPLPIDEAVAITVQLAAALEHAHARGVLHRDLKPHNVLLDERGAPRLADFGLALATDARSRLTQTGELLGTPGYLAPEQARAEKATDVRTDVYGLAALLVGLLTGEPPITARGLAGLSAVVLEPPAPPSSRRPEVPPWLDAVVLRALAKQPAARHPSAAALAQALLAGPAGGSPAPSRLRPLAAALVGGGALALAAAGWATLADRGPVAPNPELARLAGADVPLPSLAPALASLRETPLAPEDVSRRATLEGLVALARGDLARAAAVAAAAEDERPLTRALRGGVAALTTAAPPAEAIAALERAAADGVRFPELLAWRAHARARAPLDRRAAERLLADLDALRAARRGAEGPRERRLRGLAHLARGQRDRAVAALAGATDPALAWRAALDASRERAVTGRFATAAVPLIVLALRPPAPPSAERDAWAAAVGEAIEAPLAATDDVGRWFGAPGDREVLEQAVDLLARVQPPRELLGVRWARLVAYFADPLRASVARQRAEDDAARWFVSGAARLSDVAPGDYELQRQVLLLAESSVSPEALLPCVERAIALAPDAEQRLLHRVTWCELLGKRALHDRASHQATLAAADATLAELEARLAAGWSPPPGRDLRVGLHVARGHGLRGLERVDEAIAALEEARALLPRSHDERTLILVFMARAFTLARRPRDLVPLVREAYANGRPKYESGPESELAHALWYVCYAGVAPPGDALFAPKNVAAELRVLREVRRGLLPLWDVYLALDALDREHDPARAAQDLEGAVASLGQSASAELRALEATARELLRALRAGGPGVAAGLRELLAHLERLTRS